MRCRVLDLFSATLPQIFNPAVYRQGDPVHFHLEKAGAQAQALIRCSGERDDARSVCVVSGEW